MLHKEYDRKCSAEKKLLLVSLEGLRKVTVTMTLTRTRISLGREELVAVARVLGWKGAAVQRGLECGR
jgi:hypothetical protein